MTKDVDKLDKRMGTMKGAERFSTKLNKAADTGLALGTVLTAGLTVPLAGFAMSAVSAAAEAERYRNSLAGLAGGAAQAERYIRAIQNASAGAINSTDAMSYAVRGLTLGVVENAL